MALPLPSGTGAQPANNGEVVRLTDVRAQVGCLLDNYALPCHERTSQLVMGKLVGTVREDNKPKSSKYFGYNLNFNDVPSGNWNALHLHKAAEIFMPMKGLFVIHAGNGGRNQVRLECGDFIVVPEAVKRSFCCDAEDNDMAWCEALGKKAAKIFTVVPGAPWVQWAEETILQARKKGVKCDNFGKLGSDDGAEELIKDDGDDVVPKSMDDMLVELDCTAEEVASWVYRASGHHGPVKVPFEKDKLLFLEHVRLSQDRRVHYFDGAEDVSLVMISGQYVLAGGSQIHSEEVYLRAKGTPWEVTLPDGFEAALLLAVRSNVPTSDAHPLKLVAKLLMSLPGIGSLLPVSLWLGRFVGRCAKRTLGSLWGSRSTMSTAALLDAPVRAWR